MKFHILASGSDGNCAVVCSNHSKIILDCGAGKNYLKEAFNRIGIDYQQCDGLLLTHQHSDHLKQIKMFSNLNIYAPFELENYKVNIVKPYKPFTINDFTILPLLLSHDSQPTVGYIISDGSETLVQLTDSGYVSETNLKLIAGADYYLFESNHDEKMLMATDRPYTTKMRILSEHGHMNNQYASEVLCQSVNKYTKEIILAHISQQANTYALAYQTLINALKEHQIDYSKMHIKAIKQFEIYSGPIG